MTFSVGLALIVFTTLLLSAPIVSGQQPHAIYRSNTTSIN